MTAAPMIAAPKKWSIVRLYVEGNTEDGKLMTAGEVDSYSSCCKEKEKGSDLNDSMYSDCI